MIKCFLVVLPLLLNFETLPQAQHQSHVTVRGFLYQTQTGEWILAAEPGLKSCCAGSANNVERQIFVEGDVGSPTPGRVYTLQGEWRIEPVRNSAGQLQKLYHLRLENSH